MKIKEIFTSLDKKHKRFIKSLDAKHKKMLYILEFFLLLTPLLLPLYLIWFFNYDLTFLNTLTARLSSGVLNAIGIQTTLNYQYGGVSIGFDTLPQMFISNSCSGIIPIILFFGLIFALPESTLDKKARYFLFFLPVIYLINILRIVTTALVGIGLGIDYFDLFHVFLWSYLMIVVILAIWFYFIKKEKLKLTF